jgi:hypothetical protein
MGWSMDRQGIRASFDRESGRLKQVELSGSRRQRVSLHTYADELTAREAEVCREANYGQWCEPTAAPAAGKRNRNSNPHTAAQRRARGANGQSNGRG